MRTAPNIIKEVSITYKEFIKVLIQLRYRDETNDERYRFVNDKHKSIVELRLRSLDENVMKVDVARYSYLLYMQGVIQKEENLVNKVLQNRLKNEGFRFSKIRNNSEMLEKAIERLSHQKQNEIRLSFEIVERIDNLMQKRNINQSQLARQMGKKPSEINKWLSGMYNFSLKTIIELEAVLSEPILGVIPNSIKA